LEIDYFHIFGFFLQAVWLETKIYIVRSCTGPLLNKLLGFFRLVIEVGINHVRSFEPQFSKLFHKLNVRLAHRSSLTDQIPYDLQISGTFALYFPVNVQNLV
jgi:hypothetical protein